MAGLAAPDDALARSLQSLHTPRNVPRRGTPGIHRMPPSEYFQALVKRGLRVPAAYRALEREGLLRFGESPAHWRKNYREILRTRPPALSCSLVWNTVEWLRADEIQAWSPPDFWIPDLSLAAFAEDGYGGLWCWTVEAEPSEPSVVFCPPPSAAEDAECHASSFELFLVRNFVDSVTRVPEDSALDEWEDGEDYRRFLRRNIESLRPALPDHLHALLCEVVERPLRTFVEDRQTVLSLIEPDDAMTLLANAGVPRQRQTFRFMQDL